MIVGGEGYDRLDTTSRTLRFGVKLSRFFAFRKRLRILLEVAVLERSCAFQPRTCSSF